MAAQPPPPANVDYQHLEQGVVATKPRTSRRAQKAAAAAAAAMAQDSRVVEQVTTRQPLPADPQRHTTFVGRPIFAADVLELLEALPMLQCSVDFTKPDALRTRAILVENKKIYVCEYYMSIWSPVFRATFFPGDGSELERKDEKQTLAMSNAKYGSILDLLECMYPQERPVTGRLDRSGYHGTQGGGEEGKDLRSHASFLL